MAESDQRPQFALGFCSREEKKRKGLQVQRKAINRSDH